MLSFFKPKKYYDDGLIAIANEVPDKPDGSGGFVFFQMLENDVSCKDWKIKINHPEGRVFLVFYNHEEPKSLDEIQSLFDVQYKIIEIANAFSQLEKDGMIFRLREVKRRSNCSNSVLSSGPAVEEGEATYLEIVDKDVVKFIISIFDVGIYKSKKLKELKSSGYVSNDERYHSHQMNMMFLGLVVSLLVGVGSSLASLMK